MKVCIVNLTAMHEFTVQLLQGGFEFSRRDTEKYNTTKRRAVPSLSDISPNCRGDVIFCLYNTDLRRQI